MSEYYSFTIIQPDSFFVNTQIDFECDSGNHILNALPSGGTPPYSYLWPDGSQNSDYWVSATDTTTIQLLAFDDHACQSSNTNILLPYSPPTVNLQLQFNTVFFSQSLMSFQWFNNGLPLAVSDTFITVTSDGFYWIQFLDSNGCLGYSDTLYVVVSGLNSLADQPHILLTPNPGKGYFHLLNYSSSSDFVYEIHSAEGKQLIKNSAKGETYFDISHFDSGVYILSVYPQNATPQFIRIIHNK